MAVPITGRFAPGSRTEVRTSPKLPLRTLAGGRAGEIRTRDLLVPNEALYQAEPRPDQCPADRKLSSDRNREQEVFTGNVSSDLQRLVK